MGEQCVAALSCTAIRTAAQQVVPPDVSVSEIKIGNITCYTGPSKEYGTVAKGEATHFQTINDRGGINGRQIKFISLDSRYDTQKSVELAKQLGKKGCSCLFGTLRKEIAMPGYLNQKQVPQLFLESSSAIFDDPEHFPWTMGFFATYHTEGRAYAKYILQKEPDARIAVLSADEYMRGPREGL